MAVVRRLQGPAESGDSLSTPRLVFRRAAREGILYPDDVVRLLNAEDIETGTLRARNPITHDQWWIPVTALMAAGVPYARALASVVQTWLKERKGRQVRLESARVKISAYSATDIKRMLEALTKCEKDIANLHVTKASTKIVKKPVTPARKRKRR